MTQNQHAGERMKLGSVFTGIGGFDKAAVDLGMEIAFQCEIDPFCLKVLAHRFPNVKRYSDVTKLDPAKLPAVDVLCGGFPCQDLSVAGKRAGLAGSRSSLFFEFTRIADALKPEWIVIENVPGLRSSNDGRDLAVVFDTLGKLGYGVAQCSLDSQYFGVAQRRERVFFVGRFGKPCPPEILFEPESLQRDNPPRRETRESVAGTLTGGSGERGWQDPVNTPMVAVTEPLRSRTPATGGNRSIEAGQRVAQPFVDPAYSLSALLKGLGDKTSENYNLVAGALAARDSKGADNIYAEEGKRVPLPVMAIRTSHTKANGPNYKQDGSSFTIEATTSPDSVLAPTLNASGAGTERPGRQGAEPEFYVPINTQIITRGGKLGKGTGFGMGTQDDPAYTLQANHPHGVANGYGVRRLTPTECEILQAFPPGWTCLCNPSCTSTSEKHCADGPRYKALGNAVTVSTVRWIMARIAQNEGRE